VKKVFTIVGAIILVVFFFPKTSTSAGDDFTAEFGRDPKSFYKNRKCFCLGFEKPSYDFHQNDRVEYSCFGLPICKVRCRAKIDDEWGDVACEELEN